MVFGLLLVAFAATPAVLDLYAKDRKEKKKAKAAAREQKQADAGAVKANEPVKLPATEQLGNGQDQAPLVSIQPKVSKQVQEQDQVVVKQAQQPAEQSSDKQNQKPAETVAQKTAEKPADKPAEESTDKPAEKPATNVSEKIVEKSVEKAVEKTITKVSDKPADKTTVARKVDEQTRPAASVTKPKPAIAPALEAARASREALGKIPGYTCTFSKQEQLKKGSPVRQTMSLKFRREPFSVYLKFVDPAAGREVIFVEGRNNGKLQVHEASGIASLIGTINLLPTSSEAMKENKYPLTMIGMEKMLERFIVDWEESQKHADTKVMQYPQAKLGSVECTMYEVVHPEKREQFKFHMSRVYLDKKTLLPVRAEQYAFPVKSGQEPQLVEEYTYVDVKIDAALTESDFDVKNEKYGFK